MFHKPVENVARALLGIGIFFFISPVFCQQSAGHMVTIKVLRSNTLNVQSVTHHQMDGQGSSSNRGEPIGRVSLYWRTDGRDKKITQSHRFYILSRNIPNFSGTTSIYHENPEQDTILSFQNRTGRYFQDILLSKNVHEGKTGCMIYTFTDR